MKNIKLILLFLFVTFGVTAQNYENENTNKTTQEALLYLNNSKTNFSGLTPVNSVYITQQGQNNDANVVLISSDSEVAISQFGNDNIVDLNVAAQQIRASITQLGDNNNFTDYSFASQSNYNAQIYQNGNAQNIYVSGSNSLSKNIKISLTGNDKTIYINNFQ